MQSFLQDLRQALRLARRAPLTSLVVVLTLGLAIGANTAIFSVVRATFLLRLPYANADRVVDISSDNLERGWTQFGVSQPDFLDWRAEAKAFDGISAYWGGRGNLTGTDAPARIRFATVSTDIFHTLGATPALGRGFQVDDGEAGHTGVVVLSDGFWRRAMGGRRDVIGRELELDGQRLTVVGVMPAGFEFPSNGYDLWVPMGNALDPHNGRGKRFLSAVGAVARGKTPQQAEAELGAIGRRLAEEYPSTNRGWSVSMQSFRGVLVAQQSPTVLAAWASVSLVLLIAGANIANLLLVRVLRRRRELAVRSALGAARARLRRQLLTESLVLAMAGTLLGLGLAAAGLRWISALAPQGLPGADHIGLDPLALAYTVVLMLVIGVGFGTYPALRTLRADPAAWLRSGDRADVAGGSRRLRDVLVVAELGIAAMVLVGAGLTIRSMRRLLQEDPGFQTAGRLTLTLAPARNEMPERARAVQYFDEVLQAAASVPGIRRVGAINVLPVGGTWWMTSFFPEGEEPSPGNEPTAAERVVLGDYFTTMGIPLRAGRGFLPSDRADAEPVMVIDQSMADTYWPGQDPVGRRVSFDRAGRDGAPRQWFRIVGVVGSVRQVALDAAPSPTLYMPLAQTESGHFRDWQMAVVAESGVPVGQVAGAVRKAVEGVAPATPVFAERSLEDLIAANVASRRFAMTLLTGFGALALALAALGVYGLLAAVVSERTRELGLRLALGAAPERLLAGVLVDGLLRAGIGLAIGLLAAAMGSRLIGSLLYGVTATDPVTYGVIFAALLGITLLAALLPAWRAARVDPLEAMRAD